MSSDAGCSETQRDYTSKLLASQVTIISAIVRGMTPRKNYPSQQQAQFVLRMSDDLRDQIKKAVAISGRSMNTEIVHRLASTFKPKLPEEMASDAYNQVARLHSEVLRLIADFRATLDSQNHQAKPRGENVIDMVDALSGMLEKKASKSSEKGRKRKVR